LTLSLFRKIITFKPASDYKLYPAALFSAIAMISWSTGVR